MTLEKMRSYIHLNTTIKMEREKRTELKWDLKDENLTPLERLQLKRKLKEVCDNVKRAKQSIKEIEEFIDGADDFTRQILYYRYIRGLSWTHVAMETGGYNNANAVRRITERYINKSNKNIKEEK